MNADTLSLTPDETIALKLVAAIREDAEAACAPARIALVSVTFDVSLSGQGEAGVVYTPRIDRRTRTVLFTGGSATVDGQMVVKATAVYRIIPEGA